APALREPSPDDRDGARRPADLQAHQQRQRAADEQEDQAGEQKLDADDLVIFGEDVFAEEAQLGVGGGRGLGVADAHADLPRKSRRRGGGELLYRSGVRHVWNLPLLSLWSWDGLPIRPTDPSPRASFGGSPPRDSWFLRTCSSQAS